MRLWGIEWSGYEARILKEKAYRLMIVRGLSDCRDEILSRCLEYPNLQGRIIARIIQNPDALRQAINHVEDGHSTN